MRKPAVFAIVAVFCAICFMLLCTPVSAEHIGDYRLCAKNVRTDWRENWPNSVRLAPGEWLEFSSSVIASSYTDFKHTAYMDNKGMGETIEVKINRVNTPFKKWVSQVMEETAGTVFLSGGDNKVVRIYSSTTKYKKGKDLTVLFEVRNVSKKSITITELCFDPFRLQCR